MGLGNSKAVSKQSERASEVQSSQAAAQRMTLMDMYRYLVILHVNLGYPEHNTQIATQYMKEKYGEPLPTEEKVKADLDQWFAQITPTEQPIVESTVGKTNPQENFTVGGITLSSQNILFVGILVFLFFQFGMDKKLKKLF
jgi:hypothetical protein